MSFLGLELQSTRIRYKLGGTHRFSGEPSGMVSSHLVVLNVLQFSLILRPSLLKSPLSALLTEKSS